MPNHQTIVDQIRAFVGAADQTNSPELTALASEYAALCTEANARLRRCTDYLRRGLRAEAVHVAEEHPVLLELVATLDLKEAGEWAAICAMYDLTRPVPLLIEAAQELNEAYAAGHPIQALLDRHRRLALERAPLAERIAVMRELAALDTTSSFWEEDLRTFETARVKALRAEVVSAIKRRDPAILNGLLAEVDAVGWRIELPPDLRASIIRAASTFVWDEAVRQIDQLVPGLDEAYGAMDLAVVTGILQRIRAIAAAAGADLELPPDLAARLEPAEQWCHRESAKAMRQNELDAALDALTQALDVGATATVLLQRRDSVTVHGDPLPEDLAQRLAQELNRQEDAGRRRLRLRMAILAACVVVMAGIAVMAFRSAAADRRSREAADRLARMFDERDFAGVDTEVGRLTAHDPDVLRRPDVIRIREQVDEERRADRDRAVNFASALKTAREAIDAASPGRDARDSAWARSLGSVDDARRFAGSQAEKKEVQFLADRITAARGQIRDADDAHLRDMVERVRLQAKTFEDLAAAGKLVPNSEDLQRAVRETSDILAKLSTGDRNASLRQSADVVLGRLRGIVRSADRRATEQAELAAVRVSTASPATLLGALQEFARKCPESDRAARFTAAAAAANKWSAVDEFDAMIIGWATRLRPVAADLTERLEAIARYRTKYPDSPWTGLLDEYTQFLAAQKKATDGLWQNSFKKILDDPLLRDLRCVQTVTGWRYYMTSKENPQNVSTGISFRYITSSSLRDTKMVTLKVADLGANKVVPCPQAALAGTLSRMADDMGTDWEGLPFDVVSKIGDAKDVDDILRVILLGHAIQAWETHSWGTGGRLAAPARAVALLNADDLAWMDPSNQAANLKRPAAGRLLAGAIKDLKAARDAVIVQRDALARQFAFRLAGHGVLLQEPGGWTIVTADRVQTGFRAFITSAKAGWMRIAEFKGDRFVLDPGVIDRNLEGQMVFILTGSSPSSTAPTTQGPHHEP